MVDDGQTHYEVLGVDPGAGKDDIRAAYQERLDDVQAERTREQAGKRPDDAVIARGRDQEARLRAAWGVLSDPYQRGRYDASVGVPDTEARDPDTDDEDLAVATNGRKPARGERRPRPPRRERPPGLLSTEPLPIPASWPPGFHPPPPRARVMAMMIDISVLLVILIGLYVASGAVVTSVYPKETRRLDTISTQLSDIQTCIDNRPKTPNSEKAVCKTTDGIALTKKQLESLQTKRQDEQTSLRTKTAPVSTYGLFGAILLLSLLYLVPSSLRTGRTFGKRMFQIRVVQMNGAPLGLRAAITRYGLPLLFALMLQGFLGPLAYAFALIGVLTWPRNPNLQGLHDRVAGTIVVDG